MVKAWQYGDAHESYPIEVSEGWAVGEHLFICADIHTGSGQATLAHFIDTPDYAYVDPPWTQGVFQGFYTKAGYSDKVNFLSFLETLCYTLVDVRYDCFIEMGKDNVEQLIQLIESSHGEIVNHSFITYYNDRPCRLLQAVWGEMTLLTLNEMSGLDDAITPFKAAKLIRAKAGTGATLFDPCAGKGLTAKAAIQEGLNFIGVELHPRRLAWAIKYAVEATGEPARRI